MTASKDVSALIEGVVREQFAGPLIESVRVHRGFDHEGDAIFDVTVVFDKKGPLDSRKTLGIVRDVRHKLLERDEDAFPIFTFMSKFDAKRMKTEAA